MEDSNLEHFGTPYDFKSIMHYDRNGFSKSGINKAVMESRSDPLMPLGGNELSELDIKELNGVYQCDIKSGWSNWYGWSKCVKNYMVSGSVVFIPT